MAKPKRVNAFLATLHLAQPSEPAALPAQETAPAKAETKPTPEKTEPEPGKRVPAVEAQKPKKHVAPAPAVEKKPAGKTSKPRRLLKQVNLAIGKEREMKLDDLAYQYSRKKKRRINRCDIIRYLIDQLTLEELIRVDLSKPKR